MAEHRAGRSGPEPTLRRALSLPLVTFYGLGNILGAGIYVLVGKVAGEAGLYAPLAFLLAALLASLTAFTYAELSARFPLSAGEAVYVREGLGTRVLPSAVGLLIVMAGIVSAATIMKGFAGYSRSSLPCRTGWRLRRWCCCWAGSPPGASRSPYWPRRWSRCWKPPDCC